MAVYDTVLFSNTEGFGGNGEYLELPESIPEEFATMFNDWGRSGGGCVQEGPFTVPNFHVNIGEANGSSCLRRDFLPGKIPVTYVCETLFADHVPSGLAFRRRPERGPEGA